MEKDLTERACFRLLKDTEHMILVQIQVIMEELAGVLLILLTKKDVGDTARYHVHCLNLTPAMEYRVAFQARPVSMVFANVDPLVLVRTKKPGAIVILKTVSADAQPS